MKLLLKLNVAVAGFAFYGMNVLSAVAAGATPRPIPTATGPITSGSGFIDFIDKIATWVSYLFWALAVIFIFYAAFLYLTGSATEDKIKRAHKQLLYAVIAIAVALFAYGMPALIDNILRSGPPAPASNSGCQGLGCGEPSPQNY